jgi:tRNA-Thr(GGU) m(6)t(6)A37 methyltransferase TsaA
MDDINVVYKPIGVIHSPFNNLEEMPIQPTSDTSRPGTVEIYPEFVEGLKDLEGFSHIYLIYHLHKISKSRLLVTPFLDKEPHGIFATRAPSRPNPIGLSLVKIVSLEGNLIHVDQVDILDGTPLIDIKPYVPEFENVHVVKIGWLEKAKGQIRTQKSDDRFR